MLRAVIICTWLFVGCGAENSPLSGIDNTSSGSGTPPTVTAPTGGTGNTGTRAALPPVLPEGTYQLTSVYLASEYAMGYYTLGRGGITMNVKWDATREVHRLETSGTQEMYFDGVYVGIRGCAIGPVVVEICIDRITYLGDPSCARTLSDPCGQVSAISKSVSRGQFEFIDETIKPGFNFIEDKVRGLVNGEPMITTSKYVLK
ncbi:MAG: hypothetical protein FJ146_17070 [Deltaproteobacteria bacterium]|nr:hypothetical protein [Deltaproteobacteria bacterium]